MRTSVREIAFLGVTGQTETINVTDTSFYECRVTINTSAELTGAKAIAFTGSPLVNTRLDFNVVGGINSAGASKFTINGDAVPDVNAANPCLIIYRFNGATWERQILASTGAGSFIDGGSILDGTIPADKLENDIAGSGMTRDGNGGVIPNLEASQPSLQVVADELGVKIDPSRAVTKDSNGVGVNLESSDPSLQISANELGVKIAADGGLEKTANGMEIKINGDGIVKGASGLRTTNKRTIYIIASFESDAMGGLPYQVRIPDESKITAVRGSVWKEIAPADDGSIQLKASASFGVPGVNLNVPYVIPAGETVGTAVLTDVADYIPTGYTGDGAWYLGIETTKPSPGGEVYLSIDIEVA